MDPPCVIYLNCVYDKDSYEQEVKRITGLDYYKNPISNSKSFNYNSLVIDNKVSQSGIKAYYYLFNESKCQIVYICIEEQTLYGKSAKIPEEYLPKEVLELRATYSKLNELLWF